MATGFITHPDCLLHDNGEHHPEASGRLRAIQDRLISLGLFDFLRHYDAPEVTRAQLEQVHTREYLDHLEAIRPDGNRVALDPDTGMGDHSLRAARLAAGAGILATELVVGGEVENAFCAVRPPGHHAEPDRAMGFCIYSNIAVAAAHALDRFGLHRVAIVDFDVHHGNGTEAVFRDDERVLFCSAFQHPYYPYTEHADDRPHLVHTRLSAGSDGTAFREAVAADWLPALEVFAPEMLFISAGFDGHRSDDLGQLRLDESDYGWITERLLAIARTYAGGRVVSMLEGGYHLDALARSVAVHVRTLMGIHD